MEKMRHRIGSLPVIAVLIGIPALLSGCNSFALDDGIPNTAPQATVVSGRAVPPPGPVARRQGGTYPTFAGPLTAANTQIDDTEFKGQEAQMSALARARRAGSLSEAEYQRSVRQLQSLATDHATDAEAKISGN